MRRAWGRWYAGKQTSFKQQLMSWPRTTSLLPEYAQRVQVPYHVSILRGADDAESVGQMICGKADELRATLVVMAAHNKGRLVRFIVGSTTQYCIRKSHVTVLVMQNN